MKKILFLLFAVVTGVAVSGQTWTYNDCLEYARQHNISIQKSYLTEQTADFNLEEAKAQWQPSLDFATTHSYGNYPWAQERKNDYSSTYGINAGWTVWNGGRRENTIKQQRIQTEINRLNTGELVRTLETDLLQIYLNILYARESIAVYEEALKLSEAQADRAYRLMEAGKLSRVDYTQLKSQAEQDRYSLVNARGTYDSRRMELKQLLELGIDADINVADVSWDEQQLLAELPPIADSYDKAVAVDLKIKGLEMSKDMSQLDVAIAKAGHMPTVSLSGSAGTAYSAPGAAFGTTLKRRWNESLGLTLSVPIFDNKKTKTAVARARVAEMDAQLDIDKRLTDLAQAVENWYIETRSARSRYQAAVTTLESARLTEELTTERFQLGYVNTVELMSAHNSYIEARHSLLQSKYMAVLGMKMIDFYRNGTVDFK